MGFDYSALKWLMNIKTPEEWVTRWFEQLQTHDFNAIEKERVEDIEQSN